MTFLISKDKGNTYKDMPSLESPPQKKTWFPQVESWLHSVGNPGHFDLPGGLVLV